MLVMHIVAFSLNLLVCFWDVNALNAASWEFYYPFKVLSLGYILVNAYLIWSERIDVHLGTDLFYLNFLIYGFIGTKYLHFTFIFTFYELMVAAALISPNSAKRFSFISFIGLLVTLLSIHEMPEPDYIKAGVSVKGDLYVFSTIFAILTSAIFLWINRQKRMINQMNERFSLVGKQATFLLHELKAPLSRFTANSNKENDREAAHIYSIISGVESLVRSPNNYKDDFASFEWKLIEDHIKIEFQDACEQLGIKLEFSGLEGQGFGQLTTLKLAIRNLVKNAIEAVMFETNSGTIRVYKVGETISVSNTGKHIHPSKAKSFFTPFKTAQARAENLGVGLHFVEHVIKAHGGSVVFESSEDGWNTFKVAF